MFYKKQLNGMQTSIALNSSDIKQINQILNRIKKNEDLFIAALNEQRQKITNIIYVIQYICKKTNIKLEKEPEPQKKQNKTK